MISIHIINQSKHPLPAYETIASAGMDLRAELTQSISIKPLERKLIGTGLYLELPIGFEAQIRPRSGLAFKHGLTVLNSPGTIDADYRGEVKIILINLGQEDVVIQDQDRCAQLVIAPIFQAQFQLVPDLSETHRGAGGFGSTGKQ